MALFEILTNSCSHPDSFLKLGSFATIPEACLLGLSTQIMAFFVDHSFAQLIYWCIQCLDWSSFVVNCFDSHFRTIAALVLFANSVESQAFECSFRPRDLERRIVDYWALLVENHHSSLHFVTVINFWGQHLRVRSLFDRFWLDNLILLDLLLIL